MKLKISEKEFGYIVDGLNLLRQELKNQQYSEKNETDWENVYTLYNQFCEYLDCIEE